MNNLLLYCRPGFEKEAAAEITERASNDRQRRAAIILAIDELNGLVGHNGLLERVPESRADAGNRLNGDAAAPRLGRRQWLPTRTYAAVPQTIIA